VGFKAAKNRFAGDLFFTDTRPANVSTFFSSWPRHLTTYLCYGRSTRTELKIPSDVGARALLCAPRRAYGALALRDEDAALESSRLAGGGGGLLTLPEAKAVEPPPLPKKVTLHSLRVKHAKARPISMVTAYDYPSARLADAAGVDMLLVGDSLGMVVLGRDDTTDVTMDEMVHHCKAAARGTSRALLVGDLPFGSCITPVDAARNGVRLVKEGRVDAVKLEGGERMVPQVTALVDAGVAVCGHLGLTPQSYAALGGYRVQGRTAEAATAMLAEARALERAGCFALVLEMVPAPVAAAITAHLTIPVIGIGAGAGTSGQVQVFHDVLGLYDKKAPKFSKQFASFEEPMTAALRAYARAVDARAFPSPQHSFTMSDVEVAKFENSLKLEKAATDACTATDATVAPSVTALPRAATHLAAPKAPTVVTSVSEWRALQASGALPSSGVGLVPTMGALHDGHLSLMRRAQRENGATAVSLFVNPKQFAAHEDLSTYPRPWEADVARLAELGVDLVFAPTVDEMYPPHRPQRLAPFVDLHDVDETTAEGRARPGFFKGVATVVTKLLNIIQPRAVYFGQKDGMQCVVVRRLIEDLNFNTRLVIAPTVREDDGLAMSSRNAYLSPSERAIAPAVYSSLIALATQYDAGERRVATLRDAAARVIAGEPSMSLDYLSLASAVDGRELSVDAVVKGASEPTLASIAVQLGTTRLIDNVLLE